MVDKKTVEKVIALARIEASPADCAHLQQQLSKILDYIDKLKELEVGKVEAMRGLHDQEARLGSDEVKPHPGQKDILGNAPVVEGGYIKIPPVIE